MAITEDGKLYVLTLREGEGELPPKHSRCLGKDDQASQCGPASSAVPSRAGRQEPLPPLVPAARPPPTNTTPPVSHHGCLGPCCPSPAAAVHFVGRLAETGDVFMDTRQESQTEEPQVVVAGRGR